MCFEIDFLSVFFNQGDNKVEIMVVFTDVHAMGKAAGVNGSVRRQVERAFAERIAQGTGYPVH